MCAEGSTRDRHRNRLVHNTRPTKHTHQQFTHIPGQMTSHAPHSQCVCERNTRGRRAQCPMEQDVTGHCMFLPQSDNSDPITGIFIDAS